MSIAVDSQTCERVGADVTISELATAWQMGAFVLLVLNSLDLILTYAAIDLGASEANPLAVWLIDSYVAIPLKLGIALFAVILAVRAPHRVTILSVCAVWAACGVYMLVVVLNTITFLSLI